MSIRCINNAKLCALRFLRYCCRLRWLTCKCCCRFCHLSLTLRNLVCSVRLAEQALVVYGFYDLLFLSLLLKDLLVLVEALGELCCVRVGDR